MKADMDARSVAGGLRQGLMSMGGFDWTEKADASFMNIGTDATEEIAAVSASSHRLRVAMEGRTNLSMEDGAAVTGIVEVGARWDGGDGDNGAGAELGGGLNYSDPASGFSLEGRVRMLLVHQINGLKEWGASLTAKVDPGAAGRGLKFALSPVVGDAGSGIDSLLGTAQAVATGDDEEESEEFSPQVRLSGPVVRRSPPALRVRVRAHTQFIAEFCYGNSG